MIKVEELFIEPTATVLETLRKLDETGQRILFIAPEGQLKAVITDGDIRKFFLRGGTPDQTVDNAANYHPLSLPVSERGKARKMLQKHFSSDRVLIYIHIYPTCVTSEYAYNRQIFIHFSVP